MARRGFWAELHHQNQLAAKRRLQEERAHARAAAAAQRRADQARRQADRARQQQLRAAATQQKEAEREAKRLYEEARLADVAVLNAELESLDDELRSVLAATLDVDDFVDLETLRVTPDRPAFEPRGLDRPLARPAPAEVRPEPVFAEPVEPTGLSAVGGRKRYLTALEEANYAFALAYRAWWQEADEADARLRGELEEWSRAEDARRIQLEQAQVRHRREQEAREREAEDANRRLDDLVRGLARAEDRAIEEYVGIVLAHTVYPEVLEVSHEHSFDAATRELTLTVLLAPPDRLPPERSFKWIKARDETTATLLPQAELKRRYASVVDQVAVRTLHEVFEADRSGHIETIALEVATEAPSAATGRLARTPLVAVAADRATFVSFDLTRIVPEATLEHLAAARSKNPFGLVGIDSTTGVRRR